MICTHYTKIYSWSFRKRPKIHYNWKNYIITSTYWSHSISLLINMQYPIVWYHLVKKNWRIWAPDGRSLPNLSGSLCHHFLFGAIVESKFTGKSPYCFRFSCPLVHPWTNLSLLGPHKTWIVVPGKRDGLSLKGLSGFWYIGWLNSGLCALRPIWDEPWCNMILLCWQRYFFFNVVSLN